MMQVRAFLTKKILVVLLIAGVLTGGLAAYGTLGKKNRIQYQTAKAERGMIVSTVTASGQVLDLDVVEVTTQATGIVKELFVKEGDTVRAGDRLLTLELDKEGMMAKEKAWAAYLGARADLDAAEQNALSAQGSVKAAEIELENAKQAKLALEKELKLAEASLIAAQHEWDKIQSGSGTSEAQRRQKELALQAAQEALTLAQRKYKNADNSIEKAALELSIAKQRAGSGSDTVSKAAANVTVAWAAYEATLPVITAPVSGKIVSLNVVAGAAIKGSSSGGGSSTASTSPGYKVASILIGNLRLASFNVSEVDVVKVKVGQKATITVDALPGRTFTGKVVGIDRTGTVESGVTSYPVTVQFDTPSDEVLPQMAANASIITDTKDNALLIPASAVKTVQGETVVTVLRSGRVEQRPVVLGLSSGTQVEVVSGLSEGEEVVVSTLSGGQQGAGSPFGGRTGGGAMRPGSFGGTPFPAGRNLR